MLFLVANAQCLVELTDAPMQVRKLAQQGRVQVFRYDSPVNYESRFHSLPTPESDYLNH